MAVLQSGDFTVATSAPVRLSKRAIITLADAIVPDDGSENVGTRAVAGALAQIPGTTLGWGVVDDDLTAAIILNALETQGNANILSTPSLLTLDNGEAFITVGQQVPFVTGSYTNTGVGNGAQNPFQTIERQSVGVTLKVTPQVNEGDSVVLDIVRKSLYLSADSCRIRCHYQRTQN